MAAPPPLRFCSSHSSRSTESVCCATHMSLLALCTRRLLLPTCLLAASLPTSSSMCMAWSTKTQHSQLGFLFQLVILFFHLGANLPTSRLFLCKLMFTQWKVVATNPIQGPCCYVWSVKKSPLPERVLEIKLTCT